MLTEAQFNALQPRQPADGGLFDYADVANEPLQHVWTVVEGDDDGWYASPGFHVVNRLGYLLTTHPWTDETEDALWMEGSSDDEQADDDDEQDA